MWGDVDPERNMVLGDARTLYLPGMDLVPGRYRATASKAPLTLNDGLCSLRSFDASGSYSGRLVSYADPETHI